MKRSLIGLQRLLGPIIRSEIVEKERLLGPKFGSHFIFKSWVESALNNEIGALNGVYKHFYEICALLQSSHFELF